MTECQNLQWGLGSLSFFLFEVCWRLNFAVVLACLHLGRALLVFTWKTEQGAGRKGERNQMAKWRCVLSHNRGWGLLPFFCLGFGVSTLLLLSLSSLVSSLAERFLVFTWKTDKGAGEKVSETRWRNGETATFRNLQVAGAFFLFLNEPTTCKPKWDMQCDAILSSSQSRRSEHRADLANRCPPGRTGRCSGVLQWSE
jgi:hypothetical protein